MKKVRQLCFQTATIFLLVVYQVAATQEDSGKAQSTEPIDPKTTTRVALGGTSGIPGVSISVPVYFTPAERVEVGRLRLEVNFVSANMKFYKLERGIAAEMGDVELTTDLKASKNDKGVETSILTLTAGFSSAQAPKTGIPEGLLAYIMLKISDTAGPANITLWTSAAATRLESNSPLKNVRAIDAQVDVLAPGTEPMITCFFFTH